MMSPNKYAEDQLASTPSFAAIAVSLNLSLASINA